MPASLIIVLEEIINRTLRLDPDCLRRLGELHDKVIRLRLFSGEPTVIYVLPSEAGLRLRMEYDGEPDVTISGEVPVFAKLALGRFTSRPVTDADIQISGDIALGQRFQHILEKIDIDWEEQASRVVGDIAAHRLGNAVRGLRRWSTQSLSTLGEDAKEYLQEENRVLVPRARVDAFLHAVDELRVEVDRFETRLERLHGGAG